MGQLLGEKVLFIVRNQKIFDFKMGKKIVADEFPARFCFIDGKRTHDDDILAQAAARETFPIIPLLS